MNERILELAQNAGFKPFDVREDDIKFKKFALLIVRECANKQLALASNYEACATDHDPTVSDFLSGTVNGLKEGAELIKQHFGVEE